MQSIPSQCQTPLPRNNCLLKDYRIMIAKLDLPTLAGILSDASRVAMISALLDGRSLTARELSHGAAITPQTASFHLGKLSAAGLVDVVPQGRHKYYRLASDEVVATLKSMLAMAPQSKAKPAAKKQNAVCFGRTCYGHLAGRLGVAVAETLEQQGFIRRDGDSDFIITDEGKVFFTGLGLGHADLKRSRRRMASQCLDWSERHPHVGGALGHALTQVFLDRKWFRTKPGKRDIIVTAEGRQGLQNLLRIDITALEQSFFADHQ